MKTVYAKPRVMPLTNPDEIASAQSNDHIRDINGFQDSLGRWFGYTVTVERFRNRKSRAGE